MNSPRPLVGCKILIVEDDYFIADDFAAILEAAGAWIVGPAGTLSDAMGLMERTERLDGAILDINLHGEMAYTLADALR
jgi:CheY-like chemotaxis protein